MLFIVHFNWRNHSAKAGVTGIVNKLLNHSVQFSSVAQSCLTLLTPWTAAHQASLSIANSWSLLRLMSIESVMPSNHLILCRPLFLLASIFPSIKVFSNESLNYYKLGNELHMQILHILKTVMKSHVTK